LVTDINTLKHLNDDHKAIGFDDLDWSTISRETTIYLLEKSSSSKIKIIYQSIFFLLENLIKAVISNNSVDLRNTWNPDEAVSRRSSLL